MVATMKDSLADVQPIRLTDIGSVTQLVFANMMGVDQQFTALNQNPVTRFFNHLIIPLYLLTAGRGFKVVRAKQIAGFAYLSLRPRSGYIFNVVVDHPFRRQGVGYTLMTYLEREIRRKGRQWAVLQVDAGNEPAQNLYLRLGYQAYHSSFWQWNGGHWLKQVVHPEAWLEPVRGRGRTLYHYYAGLERDNGDAWAAPIVASEYAMPRPTGGQEWRCVWEGNEVGYAWAAISKEGTVLILLLHPAGWHKTTWLMSFLQLLLDEVGGRRGLIDVHVGSREHYTAAADILQPLGFTPRSQPRILMLKNVLGK